MFRLSSRSGALLRSVLIFCASKALATAAHLVICARELVMLTLRIDVEPG